MPSLVTVRSPDGAPFSVNSDYADRFGGLLSDLNASNYPIQADQSGGYANRNIAGTNRPSTHASGQAVDVNWSANPRDGSMGEITNQFGSGAVQDFARRNGLKWGGDWKNPDPMHFEVDPSAMGPFTARSSTIGDEQRIAVGQLEQTPQPQTGAPLMSNQQGGLLASLNDPASSVYSSPLTQMGLGLLASKGRASGLRDGVQNAQGAALNAQKIQDARELNTFKQSLSDPNNEMAKYLPPGAIAGLRSLPGGAAASMLSHMLSNPNGSPAYQQAMLEHLQAQTRASNSASTYRDSYAKEREARARALANGSTSPKPSGKWYVRGPDGDVVPATPDTPGAIQIGGARQPARLPLEADDAEAY
jgi:hypothetical protein